MASVEIEAVGSGVSLQDQGRSGWARFGVPRGGAMDQFAMRAANHLLGNSPQAPVLEVQQQGTKIRVHRDTWLSLAGAGSCATFPSWTARRFRAGEVLLFSKSGAGLYAYLGTPGGWKAPRWFDSVSVDPRNGMGQQMTNGSPLEAVSTEPAASINQVASRRLALEAQREYPCEEVYQILPGPQYECFTESALDALVRQPWSISAQSDRTGFRLEGERIQSAESIHSEPVVIGSFQVPESGQPIITMVDGPTVGGYPKPAVLHEQDLDRFAQSSPGTKVRFRWEAY